MPRYAFVRAALVELDSPGIPRSCEHTADHHAVRTGGERLGDVAGIADSAIANDRNARAFQRLRHSGNGADLRDTDAGDDARGANGARADAHFDRIGRHA